MDSANEVMEDIASSIRSTDTGTEQAPQCVKMIPKLTGKSCDVDRKR